MTKFNSVENKIKYQNAVSLHQRGEYEKAEKIYKILLKLNSKNSDILQKLSVLYIQSGNIANGIEYIDKAIKIYPKYGNLYFIKAEIYCKIKKNDEAIEFFRKSIYFDPKNIEAYLRLGEILHQMAQYDAAIETFDQAIYHYPGNYILYHVKGDSLFASEKNIEAIEQYGMALKISPNFALSYHNRAIVYKNIFKFDEALADFKKAIMLNPNNILFYYNLGNLFLDHSKFEDALVSYDKAIVLNTEFTDAYTNKGNALRNLNRLSEALECYNKAIAIKPDDAEANWSKSEINLIKGDFENGLLGYEWRKKVGQRKSEPSAPGSALFGECDLNGKKLFIYPELYLGDAIQFSRYAILAERLGAHVTMATNDSLHALLKTMSPTIEFISKGAIPDECDYQLALMSLPLAFKTKLESIPADIPYLKAEPERVEKWRAQLGSNGLKIGICWQGSTLKYSIPLNRSFPLLSFFGISQLSDVRLISLQKSDGIDQIDGLPSAMKVESLGEDFDSGPDAFLDTAAVMKCCDLVITSDTAIAHLAGALGIRTWVALKYVPDWRWMMDRDDSPWYPTMRLFRQSANGDWDGVFSRMKAELLKEIT